MKKFTSSVLIKVTLILLAIAGSLSNHATAQCVAYFQSLYNSSTDEVDFTPLCTYDTSVHPIVYMWDFGDGASSTMLNPSHHYASASNYTVCLYLFVGNGPGCCQDTFCE